MFSGASTSVVQIRGPQFLMFLVFYLTSEADAREQSSHHLYVVRSSGWSPVWTAMLLSWCYLQPAGLDILFFVDVFWSQYKIYISLSVSFISKRRKPVWSSLFFVGFHFCFALLRGAQETRAPSTTWGMLGNITTKQRGTVRCPTRLTIRDFLRKCEGLSVACLHMWTVTGSLSSIRLNN